MNGWELVRWMKDRWTDKPPHYVAVTTCGTENDRRRSAEAGIEFHLVKPVEPGLLTKVLEQFARIPA